MGASAVVPADVFKRAIDAVKPACSRQYPPEAEECLRIGEGAVECVSTAAFRITLIADWLAGFPPTVVSLSRLHSIAREAVGNVSLIRRDGDERLFVKNMQGGQWSLQTVAADRWPTVPAGSSGAPVCRIPCDQFARCVSCVLPAAGNDSPRWAGVMIETRDSQDAEDKVVHFTATDGRRLYTTAASFEQDVNDAAFIVPAAIMRTVAAAAARGDAPIQVCASPSFATFTVGPLVIRAGLLDAAAFPQWRKIIPARSRRPTVVSAAEMLAAVRQAAIVTSEASRSVLFTFGKRVVLKSKSADYGEAACVVSPAEVGIETSVYLDPRFVCDFLSHVVSLDGGSMVAFDVANYRDAVVLTHDDATAVVMPMSGDCE